MRVCDYCGRYDECRPFRAAWACERCRTGLNVDTGKRLTVLWWGMVAIAAVLIVTVVGRFPL